MLLSSELFGKPKGPCPICGTALCTCRGHNEPFVGTPIELAALRERADGTMTRIQATEDIIVEKPGQLGAGTLLYKKGDFIREEDAEALGYTPAKAQTAPPQDKAQRGPREKPKRGGASRDKALAKKEEES